MTDSEKDKRAIDRMAREGVPRKTAARCVVGDRKPTWRTKYATSRVEPHVPPWRCPDCGALLQVKNCLKCHNDSVKASQAIAEAALLAAGAQVGENG